MSLYDPNRIIHYRVEGKHAKALCGCKLRPGIRPRLLSRMRGQFLPPPIKPAGEGTWSGTCSDCYERAQKILNPPPPPPKEPREELTMFERDLLEADRIARMEANRTARMIEHVIPASESLHPDEDMT